MEAPSSRYPLLRGLMGTAFLLSVVYLAMGVTVELLRRMFPMALTDAAARAVDSLPAGVIRLVGAMPLLTALYANGYLPDYALRIIFGLTGVLFFHVTALVVVALTALLRRFLDRPRQA